MGKTEIIEKDPEHCGLSFRAVLSTGQVGRRKVNIFGERKRFKDVILLCNIVLKYSESHVRCKGF